MEPLVVAYLALVFGLASCCITIWRTRRSYNDSDMEELADQVARLARRSRADTMRRVRAEAKGDGEDGAAAAADAPPQLRGTEAAKDPRALKQHLRAQLLRDMTTGWRH